jgi:hypothetical protein
MGPIVVGIDFTIPSIDACVGASRLAAALNTSVDAVHVVRPVTALRRWQSTAHDAVCSEATRARGELARVVDALNSSVPIRLSVEIGEIAETLVSTAAGLDDRRALLVLGRRVRNDGPTAPCAIANRVLTPARVPVLIYMS